MSFTISIEFLWVVIEHKKEGKFDLFQAINSPLPCSFLEVTCYDLLESYHTKGSQMMHSLLLG